MKVKTRMNKIFSMALALPLVAVAACSPVKGPDEKGVTATFANENAQAFVAGYQPVEVSVTKNGNSVPASCEITSPKYSAKFAAPATVNIPAYSKGAVNATLSCTAEDVTKAATFKPVNLSKKARTGSAVGVAVLCPICGLGVAAANASKSKDNEIFGFTKMELKL